MEFSVIFEGQVAYQTRANERQVIKDGIDQAILADQLGFDRYYCVEHHTCEGYATSSAPEVLLSYIAAKTERIRIAHGIVALPFKFNHPVRAAERVATLDILSGGRVDVGAGRSSSVHEWDTFGSDPATTQQEMIESLQIMVKAWTEDEFEWHSDLIDVPLRGVRPRPVQDPHPPLLLGCSRDDTFELAGRHGLGAMSNAPDGPEQVSRRKDIYDAAFAAATAGDIIGKQPHNHFGANVFACVRDDREEGRRIGLKGMRYFMESARRWFTNGEVVDPDSWSDKGTEEALRALFTKMGGSGSFIKNADSGSGQTATAVPEKLQIGGFGFVNREFDADAILDRRASALGDVKSTAEYIGSLRDIGVDECYFVAQMGTVPHEVTMETIRQIGEKVIPQFRKPAPTVIAMS